MKLTTKGRYGLRAMLELALHYQQGPIMVDTIAKNQGISGKYVHVLMISLRKAGLIRAIRGPKGGYELNLPPKEITALAIVQALEGQINNVECIDDKCICPKASDCVSRELWEEVSDAVNKILDSKTLAALAKSHLQKQEKQMMFFI